MPGDNPTPENIRLISPPEIKVAAGQISKIRGEVKAPSKNGVFLPLGILVTQLPDEEVEAIGGTARRAGVNYIARYLLRVEVRTPGSTFGQQKLKFLAAGVMSEKGMPVLRTVMTSEAPGAVEFSVQAQLLQDGQRVGRPFMLSMPVRESETTARKYAARIMPKAKIYMQSMLPGPIISGDYELELAIVWQGRRYGVVKGKIRLQADDFPALDGRHMVLLNKLHVQNPQIAFDASQGGKRLTSLRMENRGSEAVTVNLKLPPDGWCYVRPSQLTIPPASTRGVLIGLKGRQPDQAAYQSLVLTASMGEGEQKRTAVRTLPIAWLPADAEVKPLIVGPLKWNAADKRFHIKVTNHGQRHQTPQLRVRLASAEGQQADLQAGFGVWVLPGQTTTLVLSRQQLPAGDYHYDGEIESAGKTQRFRGEVSIHP